MARQFKVAILGSSSEPEDSTEAAKAFRVGQLVALRRGILLTGGCPGAPHAAVLGAGGCGGLTVAVSPAANRAEHRDLYAYPVDSQVIIFTGMGAKGRNVVLIRSADACVFVSGGMGTLNEFTIAFDELREDCCIGVLRGAKGLTAELPRLAEAAGRRPRARMIAEADPETLVEAVFKWLHGRI